MNDIQRGIFQLIRSALTTQSLPLPEGFSLAAAEEIIIRQQIVGMAYEGAVLCGLPKDDPAMGRLFQHYCLSLRRSSLQMDSLEKLYAAFHEAGIDYMPVKGSKLKLLYPKPAMRVMGDADILYRYSQREKVASVMQALGYTEQENMSHVREWDNGVLHIEMHRQLMPDKDADYCQYTGVGWERAQPVSDCEYTLPAEDMYIFLLLHYTKHYRGSGVGLRQPIDLWMYCRAHPDMDKDYLRRELDKVHLRTFHENTVRMLEYWFADAPEDEKSEFMTQYLFSSGSWGTTQRKHLANSYEQLAKTGSLKKGKVNLLCTAIFPPMERMRSRYPVLKKAPWLYPLLVPVRCVEAMLFRRDNIRNYQEDIQAATADKMQSFGDSLRYVGLEYRLSPGDLKNEEQ